MKNNEQELFDQYYRKMMHNGQLMYAGRILQQAALCYGNRIALIDNDTTMSYKELYIRASILSDIVRSHGVKPYDRVIIFCENSFEFYIAYYAVWQAGAVAVPLNTFLKESEIAHVLNNAQPSLIIVDQAHTSLFENTQVALPRMLTQVDIGAAHPVQDAMPSDAIVDIGPSDQMVLLLYTSGTTGVPKGVMLSSKNILTNICQTSARLSITSHERLLGVLPFFHSFSQVACIWISIFMGATVIIVRKIDRHAIMHQLITHKPTMIMGIPAFYGLLCLLKTAPLSHVKYCVSGGDALPDKIRMLFALIYGRKICNGYGLTEASPVVAAELEDTLEPSGTVGRPLIGIACSIRDFDGNEIDATNRGQLWIKGDNIMLGYYNDAHATAQVIKDGWFDTGDCAYLHTNGKIVITGREKDLIIHKGFNIYPQEIENIIITHPDVVRASVIGKADEQVGEVPIAYVQLRTAKKSIENDLKNLCIQYLALYKVPRIFICDTKELPLTSTGKVDKKILRNMVNKA